MKEIAKDLIYVEINDDDTIASLKEKFINIMKKHKIKYGSINKDEIIRFHNIEWDAYLILFLDNLNIRLRTSMVAMDLPKELEY